MSPEAELYAQGLNITEVAEKLNMGRHAVSRRLARQGVALRPRNEARRLSAVRRSGLSEERVAELYAEGMTLAEIAATGGVSPTFVQDSLKRAGIARRPQLRRVRRCPKCEQEKAVLTNGYCRSCHNAYVRDRGKDGEPPAPPMSYSELEALYRLTATEKMLVLRCSHAYGSSPTPEDVLDRAGIPWRRQVALLSCTVAHARERTERRESA